MPEVVKKQSQYKVVAIPVKVAGGGVSLVDRGYAGEYIRALMELSIIIPAYNEEARIRPTLEKTVAFLDQRPWTCEILVIDDGSSDRTAERVRDFAGGRPGVRCLRNDRNRGKGFSIRHGVGVARGRYIGFMDADYKTDISGLDAAWTLLEEGFDAVVGDRTLEQTRIATTRRRYRQLGSELFRYLLHRFIGLEEFGDTQCGFKFFRAGVARDLFARQKVDGFMFDVEILLLASRSGYRIARIPVIWRDDPDSRFRPFTGTLRNLGELARICRRHGRKKKQLKTRSP